MRAPIHPDWKASYRRDLALSKRRGPSSSATRRIALIEINATLEQENAELRTEIAALKAVLEAANART